MSLQGTEISWSRAGPRPGMEGEPPGTVPVDVYDNLYRRFNPTSFDARRWVAIARSAGMKYFVFTTKHHDGFCMFDSAVTDYKITNTPFKRDVTEELATACHQAGLKLGFYYSPADWHHPDYRTANHARYIQYMHNQLRELCTRYGRVDVIWFDGLHCTAADWDSENLFAMIRRLQPGVLINDRAGLPGDFDTPEQEVGSFQVNRPWESCITIGEQWSYDPHDKIKSCDEIIQTLAKCAGGNGNLLLNVGPTPKGEIEPDQADRLARVGQWLDRYGNTIYSTHGGPYVGWPWGASTCRDNTISLHVFNWAEELLKLPATRAKIISCRVLTGGTVAYSSSPNGFELHLPADRPSEADTVISLELDQPAARIEPIRFEKSKERLAAPYAPKAILTAAPELRLPGVTNPDKGWDGYVDCSSPLHWDGNTLYVFSSASHPYRSFGPDLEHLSHPSQRVTFDNDPGWKEGGRWMESTHKQKRGPLYGWYHNEPPNLCGRQYMTAPRIGAAVSTDNGLTWKDLGFILKGPPDALRCDSPNAYFVGGNGDFTVILDRAGEYFYFLFGSYYADPAEQGISIARMRFTDRNQPVGRVWKWYRGDWHEPGVGGHVTPIFPATGDWHKNEANSFWGPSIHWNKYLNQFVILMSHARDAKWTLDGTFVTFNPDLADPTAWSEPQRIRNRAPFYPQVVGTDRTQHETDKLAGRSPRFFLGNKSRWKIVFLKPGEKSPATQTAPASASSSP